MASISLFLKFHLEKNPCYNDSSRLSGRWPPETGSREPQTCVARGLQKRISCQSADPTDGLRATAVLRHEKQSSLFPNPHSPARQGGCQKIAALWNFCNRYKASPDCTKRRNAEDGERSEPGCPHPRSPPLRWAKRDSNMTETSWNKRGRENRAASYPINRPTRQHSGHYPNLWAPTNTGLGSAIVWGTIDCARASQEGQAVRPCEYRISKTATGRSEPASAEWVARSSRLWRYFS